jgi:AraC-like DNA-binding protein
VEEKSQHTTDYDFEGVSFNNETFQNYWSPKSDYFEVTLCECGYEYCDPSHYWGPDTKKYHSIHYILSGKGTVDFGNQRFQLSAGDGFYIQPNQVVHYYADKEDPWEYRWVGYSGSKVNVIMNETSLSVYPIFNYTRDGFFKDNLQQIYDYSLQSSTGSRECLILGQLYFFMAGLLQRFKRGEEHKCLSGEEYVNKAITLIQENYINGFNVDDIAKKLGLTRSYLYKLFIRYQGISPIKYIEQHRFKRACELFKTQNVIVSDVARAVGFNDQFYFSRRFREVIGISPTEYQQKAHKKPKKSSENIPEGE